MKQYIVDAFTDKVFQGNPAAVCIMEEWLQDDIMQKIAIENNLSETAFAVKENKNYHLRWFTPGGGSGALWSCYSCNRLYYFSFYRARYGKNLL